MRTVAIEGAYVHRLPSRLDVTTVADARHDLHAAIDGASGDLVLDLGDVDVLDAAGLGMLVAAHRRASRRGQRLVLRSVPGSVARVLAMTRLHRVLHIEPASELTPA